MEIVLKGAEYLEKWADQKQKETVKAMHDAIRITANQIRIEMRDGLKQGGLNLAPTIRSKMNPKQSRNPLGKLAVGILYKYDKVSMKATIGFHGDTARTAWTSAYATFHKDGGVIHYTDAFKTFLHKKGIHIKNKTMSAMVPARDILGQYFRKYQTIAIQRLKDNFVRKLRGERI